MSHRHVLVNIYNIHEHLKDAKKQCEQHTHTHDDGGREI